MLSLSVGKKSGKRPQQRCIPCRESGRVFPFFSRSLAFSLLFRFFSWSSVDLFFNSSSPPLPFPPRRALFPRSPPPSPLAIQIDQLKQFRQWGSMTPGHPENFETKGIEVTTGELMMNFFSSFFFLLLLSSSFAAPSQSRRLLSRSPRRASDAFPSLFALASSETWAQGK